MPDWPTTRFLGKPVTRCIKVTIASRGLVPTKSSRLMPGLRAMPAVTMQTSAPAISSYLFVPMTLPSNPSTGPACERSSALPWGRPSITSNKTTSPKPLSKQRWAIEPPILPAPISAIFFRAIISSTPLESKYSPKTPQHSALVTQHSSHIRDNRVAEARATDQLGARHQALEIVGDGLVVHGAFAAFY